jgi:hypothetical protein
MVVPFQLTLFFRLLYRTDSVALINFLITPRHGPPWKTPFPTVPLLLHAYLLPRERVYKPFPSSGRLLLLIKIYCIAANAVSLLVSRSLPRNGSIRHNVKHSQHCDCLIFFSVQKYCKMLRSRKFLSPWLVPSMFTVDRTLRLYIFWESEDTTFSVAFYCTKQSRI